MFLQRRLCFKNGCLTTHLPSLSGLPDLKEGRSGWIKTTQVKDTDSWYYGVKQGYKKGEIGESFAISGT